MKEMISQMIVVGFSGQRIGDKWIEQIKRDINSDKIGGIYIARENVKNFKQVTKIINYLKNSSTKNLLVLSKPDNFPTFVNDNKSYNLNSIETLNKVFYKKIHNSGINMLLWPNADLYLDVNYNGEADIAVTYLTYKINVIKKEGIVPVVGHFPGKMPNNIQWDFDELKPYFELIKHDKIQAVFMNDVLNKKLDSKNIPTFSSIIIHKILREKLKFTGLIFSSDLKNSKINKKYNFKDMVIKAVNAGNDILFFSSYFANSTNVPREVRMILSKAVDEGKVKKSTIMSSYKKIIKFKKRLNK
jgi:beta-N-acetylhexosaminidase